MKRKTLSIILISVIVLIVAGYMIWNFCFDPYRGTITEPEQTLNIDETLTKQQAIQDLDYVVEHIGSRHPACINGIKEEILIKSQAEKDSFGEQVSVLELWQAISRTMSAMKDGHTSVGPVWDDVSRLPIQFQVDKGNLICKGGKYDGYNVKSIGGIPADQLYKTFLEQSSYELEGFAQILFENHIGRMDYLRFLGVEISDNIDILFSGGNGDISSSYNFGHTTSNNQAKSSFVDYKTDTENGIGIFTLNECNNNEEYRNKLKEFFTEVKEHNIHTVAVDLRNNGGGNSLVINEFFRYLDTESYYVFGNVDIRYGPFLNTYKKVKYTNDQEKSLVFDGNLYVLTSFGTFSSATDFATVVSDNGMGSIVGEVSGGMPSSYGDLLIFQTPNSKLQFTVSYKYFHRPCSDKDDEPLWPDYETDADKAIEKVYELASDS